MEEERKKNRLMTKERKQKLKMCPKCGVEYMHTHSPRTCRKWQEFRLLKEKRDGTQRQSGWGL